jgi:predicted PurR-regulated permease PerM
LGAFFAWEPRVYKAIVLSLLPQNRRKRVNEVLDLAGHALREWLIGQGISMAAIFLFCLCALTLVGMPYSILLAVQAGLLTFIPTLGPFVAGVIIILAGLSQSFSMALYGLITYVLVQFIETHLVTPLAQEQTVRFPPASTLSLQVLAVFLFGLMGIVFAVPISAAGRVFVEELYVRDQLGGPWHDGDRDSWIGDWMRSFRYWIRGKWLRRAVCEVVDRIEEIGPRAQEPPDRGNAGEKSESNRDAPERSTTRRIDRPPL